MILPLVLFFLVHCSVECSRGRGQPTTPAPPPLPGPMDLTLTLDQGDQPFTRNTTAAGEHGWYSVQSSCNCGELGTHIAAPYHLSEHGWKVDELPLERLLVPGVLLDVSAEVAHNASFLLTAEHLVAWEKKYSAPPLNSLLLIKFGWGPRLRAPGGGPTTPAPDHPQAPGVSKEAVTHLVAQGRVVGVGVDLPSLDAARVSVHAPAARALLAANMYTLLNLDLRRELPAKGFSVLVLPAKVRGAAVAGARVVATASLPAMPAPPAAKRSGAGPAALPGLAALASLSALVLCLSSPM